MDRFLVTIDGETMLIADAYMRVLEPEGYPGFWEKVWKANIGLLFNDEFVQSRLGSYLITSIFEERYGRFNADPTRHHQYPQRHARLDHPGSAGQREPAGAGRRRRSGPNARLLRGAGQTGSRR